MANWIKKYHAHLLGDIDLKTSVILDKLINARILNECEEISIHEEQNEKKQVQLLLKYLRKKNSTFSEKILDCFKTDCEELYMIVKDTIKKNSVCETFENEEHYLSKTNHYSEKLLNKTPCQLMLIEHNLKLIEMLDFRASKLPLDVLYERQVLSKEQVTIILQKKTYIERNREFLYQLKVSMIQQSCIIDAVIQSLKEEYDFFTHKLLHTHNSFVAKNIPCIKIIDNTVSSDKFLFLGLLEPTFDSNFFIDYLKQANLMDSEDEFHSNKSQVLQPEILNILHSFLTSEQHVENLATLIANEDSNIIGELLVLLEEHSEKSQNTEPLCSRCLFEVSVEPENLVDDLEPYLSIDAYELIAFRDNGLSKSVRARLLLDVIFEPDLCCDNSFSLSECFRLFVNQLSKLPKYRSLAAYLTGKSFIDLCCCTCSKNSLQRQGKCMQLEKNISENVYSAMSIEGTLKLLEIASFSCSSDSDCLPDDNYSENSLHIKKQLVEAPHAEKTMYKPSNNENIEYNQKLERAINILHSTRGIFFEEALARELKGIRFLLLADLDLSASLLIDILIAKHVIYSEDICRSASRKSQVRQLLARLQSLGPEKKPYSNFILSIIESHAYEHIEQIMVEFVCSTEHAVEDSDIDTDRELQVSCIQAAIYDQIHVFFQEGYLSENTYDALTSYETICKTKACQLVASKLERWTSKQTEKKQNAKQKFLSHLIKQSLKKNGFNKSLMNRKRKLFVSNKLAMNNKLCFVDQKCVQMNINSSQMAQNNQFQKSELNLNDLLSEMPIVDGPEKCEAGPNDLVIFHSKLCIELDEKGNSMSPAEFKLFISKFNRKQYCSNFSDTEINLLLHEAFVALSIEKSFPKAKALLKNVPPLLPKAQCRIYFEIDYWNMMGHYYMLKNKHDSATHSLKTAIQKGDNCQSTRGLAFAYHRLGKLAVHSYINALMHGEDLWNAEEKYLLALYHFKKSQGPFSDYYGHGLRTVLAMTFFYLRTCPTGRTLHRMDPKACQFDKASQCLKFLERATNMPPRHYFLCMLAHVDILILKSKYSDALAMVNKALCLANHHFINSSVIAYATCRLTYIKNKL